MGSQRAREGSQHKDVIVAGVINGCSIQRNFLRRLTSRGSTHSMSPSLQGSVRLHVYGLSRICRKHICECHVSFYGLPMAHPEAHDMIQSKAAGRACVSMPEA